MLQVRQQQRARRRQWAKIRARAERALRDFDPNEPRDDQGRWTDEGGDDGSDSDGAGLDPKVVEVGGDKWNKDTAKRLEREYQDAKPALDAIVAEPAGAAGETADEDLPPDEDEDGGPYVPDEWEGLSADDQEQAKDAYISANKESYYDGEVQNWQDSGNALDDAKASLAYSSGSPKHDTDDWLENAIDEFRNEYDTRIPYETGELINAIELDYQSGYEGKGDFTVKFLDDKLRKPDPGQQTLPGIEPPPPGADLTKQMREDLEGAISDAFDKESQELLDSGKIEPPEYLGESADEFVAEDWENNMSDEQKFDFVEHNTNILDQYKPDENSPAALGKPQEPNKYDPLNDTSGTDYKRTQAMAKYLSVERAKQVLQARGLPVPSMGRLSQIDNRLWQGWKQSSTNDSGKLLQAATADELGGRLNRVTTTLIDPELMRTMADREYKDIGGYNGVKAYVRAKWETTQYLLDKAGIKDLQLYRGIRLEKDMIDKWFAAVRRHLGAGRDVEGFKNLPTLQVVRNGAASTSTNKSIANGWGADANRVVLRAHVPRTAAISVPAYGQNIHSEQEVVVAGTAWKAWDAWHGRAPGFGIPMQAAA